MLSLWPLFLPTLHLWVSLLFLVHLLNWDLVLHFSPEEQLHYFHFFSQSQIMLQRLCFPHILLVTQCVRLLSLLHMERGIAGWRSFVPSTTSCQATLHMLGPMNTPVTICKVFLSHMLAWINHLVLSSFLHVIPRMKLKDISLMFNLKCFYEWGWKNVFLCLWYSVCFLCNLTVHHTYSFFCWIFVTDIMIYILGFSLTLKALFPSCQGHYQPRTLCFLEQFQLRNFLTQNSFSG